MLRVAAFLLPVVVVLTGLSQAAQAPVQPGFDTAAQISPNGSWLLFQRLYGGSRYSQPDTTLRIARADGTGDRELVGRRIWVSLDAFWTPDDLVAVILSEPDGSVVTTLRRPEDGSIVRQLPVAPRAWSPNGAWIAYVDGRELYVARPDGSEPHVLASAPEQGWVGAGEFSPDSTRLSYVVGEGLPDAQIRSEVVRIDGTERHLLRRAPVVSTGKWSPNGDALVLMAQNDAGRYRPPRVYVVSADGSSTHAIAPGHATSPDWSPLGDWIAYERQTATPMRDLHDLMIVRPNGTDRRRVVRTGGDGGGTWLADGRHVLTIGSGACRRGGVIEIDVFRRTVRRLTNRCRIDGTPRADKLTGTPLRDLIDGRGGDDGIVGGGGDDRMSGGPGADTIISKDRYRDSVRCGPGLDRVVADYRDRLARDCERVRRR
jgi:hypothetical protein